MIQNLEIKNFKSIKDLSFPCKKLNVFIGEPNSGKSNIIEALSLRSQNALGNYLDKDIFRFKSISDLFYDFNISNPIEIKSDDGIYSVLKFGTLENGEIDNQFHFYLNSNDINDKPYKISHDGRINSWGSNFSTNVRFYNFKRLQNFTTGFYQHLSVPSGDNLPSLLISNTENKKWVSEFLKSKGLTLTLKPAENEILVSKFIDDEIYSYPYFSISETLQRIIFYTIALKSNSNSIILLDEPESNTFPFYTKYIAERIALDETNQFFITTHNPYLLQNLIEKSTLDDINVCIVTMKDYQTKVVSLNENQISKVLDFNSDVFFNLENVIE